MADLDPVTGIGFATPQLRHPLRQVVPDFLHHEVVALGHDQLHRNFGTPHIRLQHAVEHIGAIQVDAVHAVRALRFAGLGLYSIHLLQKHRPELVRAQLPHCRRQRRQMEHADIPGVHRLPGDLRQLLGRTAFQALHDPVAGVVQARAGDRGIGRNASLHLIGGHRLPALD
jgi:hypothetical protein